MQKQGMTRGDFLLILAAVALVGVIAVGGARRQAARQQATAGVVHAAAGASAAANEHPEYCMDGKSLVAEGPKADCCDVKATTLAGAKGEKAAACPDCESAAPAAADQTHVTSHPAHGAEHAHTDTHAHAGTIAAKSSTSLATAR
jgi:hypothetical protein